MISSIAYPAPGGWMNKDLESIVETELSGKDLMSNPLLNKGTVFTHEERIRFAQADATKDEPAYYASIVTSGSV
jgi:hypothetical protein